MPKSRSFAALALLGLLRMTLNVRYFGIDVLVNWAFVNNVHYQESIAQEDCEVEAVQHELLALMADLTGVHLQFK